MKKFHWKKAEREKIQKREGVRNMWWVSNRHKCSIGGQRAKFTIHKRAVMLRCGYKKAR